MQFYIYVNTIKGIYVLGFNFGLFLNLYCGISALSLIKKINKRNTTSGTKDVEKVGGDNLALLCTG